METCCAPLDCEHLIFSSLLLIPTVNTVCEHSIRSVKSIHFANVDYNGHSIPAFKL